MGCRTLDNVRRILSVIIEMAIMKQVLTFNPFSVLIALTLAFTGCQKVAPYMSNAEITGFDAKMCSCCGGIKIIIDNVANPNGNNYLLIDQLPTNLI